MKIKLDTLNLYETLKYFYMLTGVRTVIFDSEFKEIFSYPETACNFCSVIRKNPDLMEKCRESDLSAFEKCKNMENIFVYKCHAGLVEAVMPIKNEKRIIGYIMLGQITDIKDKAELKHLETDIFEKYGVECNTTEIKYKNKNQILAASKLLEICTDYMLLKEMIGAERDTKKADARILSLAKEYILKHLSDQINIYDLCDYTKTNRTKLYEIFKSECGYGIASYIKDLRLNEAKRLLRESKLSVSEISTRVGFADYNYFSRVYKNRFKISPHKDREE